MGRGDIADTAGDHDRLVIAAHILLHALLEGAEVACQVWAAEFVVEGSAPDWTIEHDLQRRSNARGRSDVVSFPGLLESGYPQVGYAETGQARFGFCPPACCAFIADFSTRAGCRSRIRRDRSRMIVRLHLHDDVG